LFLIVPILAVYAVVFGLFGTWWALLLPRSWNRRGGGDFADFQRFVARPFGALYVSTFLAHAGLAVWSPHPWQESWSQFLVYGLGPIIGTYLFQCALLYPWYRRLTGEGADGFLRSALAYLRLTAALLAPFFIYQFLNATLFDPPAGRIDAVEIVVFTAGRVVILSLLTVVFSVMFMLRMVPNSAVVEEEHLARIHRRLKQAGWHDCRLRWIDIPGFNNAFVVGFKWFGFTNQTMFIGRSLCELLTLDEFDAVISHELGHMCHGHLLKRITYGMSLVAGLVLCLVVSLALSVLVTLAVSDDPHVTAVVFGASLLVTLVGSYLLLVTWLFRLYRQQEHEADSFAVMRLGIRLEDLENSLRKVTQKFNQRARRRTFWAPFATHPGIDARIETIRHQMHLSEEGHDWNTSLLSRLLEITVRAASPRTLAITFTLFVLSGLLTHSAVERNRSFLRLVERADLAAIDRFTHVSGVINSRQYLLFGLTPLEMALHRADLATVRHLMARGADPARGSGFSSPLDVAISRRKWAEADYLLGQLPDSWLQNNALRLLRQAAREESGQALGLVLAHRLHRFVSPAELALVVDRVVAQRSDNKLARLREAGVPTRTPASVP